ncbi:MAG: hypothetical protein WCI41_02220 [bacterium]
MKAVIIINVLIIALIVVGLFLLIRNPDMQKINISPQSPNTQTSKAPSI